MPDSDDTTGKMTIIAFSGDLDKLWPTMILSSTAAASGMDVTVFYTFWGLFPLVRDDVRMTGHDAMTRALSAMNPPGFARARLSRHNWGDAGRLMMRRLAERNGLRTPEELFVMGQEMGVRMWPCRTTMDLLGIERDQLVGGLGEPTGAATALAAMAESRIQLFI